MAESDANAVNMPLVVSFAYTNFKADSGKGKWAASCKSCKISISDTRSWS